MPLAVPYSTHHLHQFHLSIISFLFIEQHQLPCPSAVFPSSIPHFKLLSLLSKTSLLIFLHQQYNTIILVHHRCSILPSYWLKRPSAPPSSACLASAVERLCCCLLRPCESSPSSALCGLHLVAAFECWCYHRPSPLQLLHLLPCSVSVRPPLQLLFAVAGRNRWAREDQNRDSCSSFFFASLPESRNRLSSSFSLAVILIISSFSSSFFLLLLPLLGVAVAVTISSSYPSSSVLAAASFSSSSSREAVASSWGPELGGRCCIVLLLPLFLVTPRCCHCGRRCWAVCRPCCRRCCCCCSYCSCCQTPFPATEPRKSLLSLPWTSVLGRLCLSLVFG